MQSNYIARLANNKLVCFFYTKEKTISYRYYDRGKWTKPRVIVKEALPDFTVNFSPSGSLYIFCQDNKGSIVMAALDGNAVSHKTIMENNAEQVHTILFHSMLKGNAMSLVYNIPSDDKKFKLVFQNLLENGVWEKPMEIDKFFPLPGKLFEVQHINSRHALAFYRSENNIAGYREITPEKWGDFTGIQRYAENIANYSFLATEETLHTLYISTNLFSGRVIYSKKEKEQFEKPLVLWEGAWVDNCLLAIIEDVVHAFFISGGNLYASKSSNGGQSFTRPEIYRNKFCLNPVKAVYISQNQMEESDHYCREVYVDSHYPWDIQLLPDMCEDFFFYEEPPAPMQEQIANVAQIVSPTQIINPAQTEEAPPAPNPELPNLALIKERFEKLAAENQEQKMQIGTLTQTLRERDEIEQALIRENSANTTRNQRESAALNARIQALEAQNQAYLAEIETVKNIAEAAKTQSAHTAAKLTPNVGKAALKRAKISSKGGKRTASAPGQTPPADRETVAAASIESRMAGEDTTPNQV